MIKPFTFLKPVHVALPLVAGVVSLMVGACAPAVPTASVAKEGFNENNDPGRFQVRAKKLADIRTSARLDPLPWSGDYWPSYAGGITRRWQQPIRGQRFEDNLYEFPRSGDIPRLTTAEIAALSPAEKYDIWQGRDNLVLSQTKRFRLKMDAASPDFGTWQGICSGWSTAAIYEKEPKQPVVVTNPRGQQVTFYGSDLKALASEFYAQSRSTSIYVGQPCMSAAGDISVGANGRVGEPDCRDLNPAAFLVVLDAYIGANKPLIVDIYGGAQLWNQPIAGYKVTLGASRSAAGVAHVSPRATRVVDAELTLDYISETNPALTEPATKVETRKYRFTVEVDAGGVIVGGEWKENATAGGRVLTPDYIWLPDTVPQDSERLSLTEIRKLIALSTKP